MNKENKNMAEANYNYYQKNINELIKSYSGEYIIVQDLKVICNDKSKSAVTIFADTLEAGTFIILKIQNRKN